MTQNWKHNNPQLLHYLHALNVKLAEKQKTYKQVQQELAQAKFELENFVKQNKIQVGR
jgi:ABC-type proline/glycine betaine transport system substrate-binding protein